MLSTTIRAMTIPAISRTEITETAALMLRAASVVSADRCLL